jgi:hypothetical protein
MERDCAFSERLARYNLYILELGGRSSMSKTDKDASFMRMKDGHMMNGQLKPGYSIQLAIDGEYIVGTNVSANANDTGEEIPMLEKIDEMGMKYSNIVDDAGYDSEENTAWLEKRGFKCYIKPQNYAKKQKRSFKKDRGARKQGIQRRAGRVHMRKRQGPEGGSDRGENIAFRL